MSEPGGKQWGVGVLVLATALWGTTFAIVKQAMGPGADRLSPAVLLWWRFVVAAVVFVPFLRRGWRLWLAASELSMWLWLGYATQTVGLQYTSAGRSAFLTSLNVIIVPMFVGILGRRTRVGIWIAAALALAGVALLSWDGGPPNRGDLWTVACAVAWAAYITRLERFAKHWPTLPLAGAHLIGVVILNAAWLLADGGVQAFRPTLLSGPQWAVMLYLGAVATAGTTWLQWIGQRQVSAPRAAVIYTLEPVWASGVSYVMLGELFGARGWAGAALVLAASVMASSPWDQRRSTVALDVGVAQK